MLKLGGADRTLVAEYSTGMRKKIGLAAALLHAPKLLVLDGPLEAVDPVSAATIRVILQRFVRARDQHDDTGRECGGPARRSTIKVSLGTPVADRPPLADAYPIEVTITG